MVEEAVVCSCGRIGCDVDVEVFLALSRDEGAFDTNMGEGDDEDKNGEGDCEVDEEEDFGLCRAEDDVGWNLSSRDGVWSTLSPPNIEKRLYLELRQENSGSAGVSGVAGELGSLADAGDDVPWPNSSSSSSWSSQSESSKLNAVTFTWRDTVVLPLSDLESSLAWDNSSELVTMLDEPVVKEGKAGWVSKGGPEGKP